MARRQGLNPYWERCFTVLVVAVMTSLTLGCSGGTIASSQPEENPDPLPQGQQLPIEAVATIGDRRFDLEVARTTEQQRLGLMFRDPLPEGQGMIFPFVPPRPANFWMFNVKFPLDMVFMLEGEVVHIEASVPGCSERPCPSYGPPQTTLVDSVLELNGGTADGIGLQVGDTVEVNFLDSEAAEDRS